MVVVVSGCGRRREAKSSDAKATIRVRATRQERAEGPSARVSGRDPQTGPTAADRATVIEGQRYVTDHFPTDMTVTNGLPPKCC